MEVVRPINHITPAKAEDAYNRLTSYRFAEQYVEGKTVLDIATDSSGYGTHLLAETAENVEGLVGSSQALERASTIYPAPNVNYQEVRLPKLPYEGERFDVAVSFEVVEELERPEELVAEAKRVLTPEGTFIVSTPDKQAHSNERNYRDPSHKREMYVLEFRKMLERHFRDVRLYRQGAVAGGLIFEADESPATVPVRSARFSATNPAFDAEPPTTHFVVAVCSDSEPAEQENRQPCLILDHDRRIFEECEDSREDVELLRAETQRMQETEVQAFQDTLGHLRGEIVYLKAQLARSEAQIQTREQDEAQIRQLKAHIHAMENSRVWRLFEPYRRLRARVVSPSENPNGK